MKSAGAAPDRFIIFAARAYAIIPRKHVLGGTREVAAEKIDVARVWKAAERSGMFVQWAILPLKSPLIMRLCACARPHAENEGCWRHARERSARNRRNRDAPEPREGVANYASAITVNFVHRISLAFVIATSRPRNARTRNHGCMKSFGLPCGTRENETMIIVNTRSILKERPG